MLPFIKPSTHTAQLKRGFSFFQDLLRKAHSIWDKTWAHSTLSHGLVSTTSPAPITPTRTVTPSKQMFSPFTGAAGSQYADLSAELSKNVQRPQTTEPSFAQFLLISLANLQTKYRQTLSRSMLSYFHHHQWSCKNLRQQRILHQTTTCHPSQNLNMKQIIFAYLKC